MLWMLEIINVCNQLHVTRQLYNFDFEDPTRIGIYRRHASVEGNISWQLNGGTRMTDDVIWVVVENSQSVTFIRNSCEVISQISSASAYR